MCQAATNPTNICCAGTVICAPCRKTWKKTFASTTTAAILPTTPTNARKRNATDQQRKQAREDAAIKSGGHSPTKKQKLIDLEDRGDLAKVYAYAKRMKATAEASGKEHFTVHDPCKST
jgi:hypothetical protein